MAEMYNTYQFVADMIEDCSETLHDCHAVYEHSFKTDEYLMNRCLTEDVKGASCFFQNINIEELICDMMYDSPDLPKWLCTGKEPYFRIVCDMEHCGKKYLKGKAHNWQDGPIICNQVLLFLGKDTDAAGGCTRLYVLTCYPA